MKRQSGISVIVLQLLPWCGPYLLSVVLACVPLVAGSDPWPWLAASLVLSVLCTFCLGAWQALGARKMVATERLRSEGDLSALEFRLRRQLTDTCQDLADGVAGLEGKHTQLRADLAEALSGASGEVADLHLHFAEELEKLVLQLGGDLQDSARQQSKARDEALQSVISELTSVRDELRGKFAQLQSMLEGSTEDFSLLAGEVEGQLQKIRHTIAETTEKADAVESQVREVHESGKESLLQMQEHMEKGQSASMDAIGSRAEALREEMSGIRRSILDDLGSFQEIQTKAKDQSEESMKSIEQELLAKIDITEQVLFRTNILNYRLFHSHSRLTATSDLELFEQNWLPVLNLDFTHQGLGYLAHKICLMEDRCLGRLAASVQDVMLRILLARHFKGASLQVLEIGSLFGIALAAMYENTQGFIDKVSFTSIDPLDGYYLKGNDSITGMPVSLSVFEHNMSLAGVDEREFDQVQHLSTDPQAFEQVKDRQFDLLVIDGDHSYAGIQFDFETYGPLVRRGGLVLFDDYNQQNWPEVTQFVDEKVKGQRGWKLVGADWHSIVFRRTGARSKKKQPS
jgi:hypothetical protein